MSVPLDPVELLQALVGAPPLSLDALPRDHGIYALRDHSGAIRYIGITKGDRYGFYGRINNRHVTGSEGRSHKFSHAYNTGRMWRGKRDSQADAKLAKGLRARFVRRYCRASVVVVAPAHWPELGQLERQVPQLAPSGMMDWGDKRDFSVSEEPRQLVDALIEALGYSVADRAALQRQAARFVALSESPEAVFGRT